METLSNNKNEFLQYGPISGIVGGIAFGIMMQIMGMMPTIGMLVGIENTLVGWIVHLIISAIFGAMYGIYAVIVSVAKEDQNAKFHIISGIAFGIFWWIIGPLISMPLILNTVNGMQLMPLFAVNMEPVQMSFLGHLMFALILVAVYKYLQNKE